MCVCVCVCVYVQLEAWCATCTCSSHVSYVYISTLAAYVFYFTEELYADVNEDFFAFNKIPRILFQHKARYLRTCTYCICKKSEKYCLMHHMHSIYMYMYMYTCIYMYTYVYIHVYLHVVRGTSICPIAVQMGPKDPKAFHLEEQSFHLLCG